MAQGTSIVGTWNVVIVDWGCGGNPLHASPFIFNADGTWTYQFGGGRWIQVEGMATWTFDNAPGLIYTADVTRDALSGVQGYASAPPNPGTGCFYALRQPAPAAAPSLARTPAPGHDAAVGPEMQSLHVLAWPDRKIPETAPRLAADGGPYTQRGSTQHFTVYYEDSLGANGPILADAVLASCENDYASLQNYFGNIAIGGLPFSIYVVSGNFGAYHASCAATECHCAAFAGTDADLVRMLVVAEADEVFMADQNVGWDCGASNGEGLSRVLATELYPAELNGFASAASWLNSNRPNFVNNNDPTDQNYVSIGCSTLFLNYLHYQLGFSWPQIVQAGGATLAQTSANLGGSDYPFEPFALLLELNFPSSTPVNLGNDNPFPLQMPTVPLSGLVHLQNIGDVGFVNDEFAGTQGQSRRLEGFQIQFNPPVPGLSMRYMAHLQNIGDVQWVDEGQFIGTRGQSRRLEGFAIELTGPAAANYTVMYMAHLQDIGDTGFFRDGQFCGTRGQSKRVEGILVHVGPR